MAKLFNLTLIIFATFIINISQAFLFHQIQPASTSYLNSFENATYYQQQHFSIRNAPNNRQQQQQHYHTGETSQINTSTNDNDDSDLLETVPGCPKECECNKVAQIADCSNRNLLKVPNTFPKDIKRIRLERNNITELGPYAFQGLNRLQRIDLSNNNLLKIDPLAFSGGLQSLNSLILYSNKLSQLPMYLFKELSQLQLLLLNANSLECIHKDLFQSLTNLNLLSLYDNNIEAIANGTFDGLKNIKTIHLAKNPLVCDCNLRWLADYLDQNPIETSEAQCEGPNKNRGKKLIQLSKQKFKCEGVEALRTSQISSQCGVQPTQAPAPQQQQQPQSPTQSANDQSCPRGCICNGASVDCSQSTESRVGSSGTTGGLYEVPDIPDDIPVYVSRIRLSDPRIKRIRQTGIFQRLANSQKLDLGGGKIIDIEDNAINGGAGSGKPERVVFILLEKDGPCDSLPQTSSLQFQEDACSIAPKVNAPTLDSPCYNRGKCVSGTQPPTNRAQQEASLNYSCICPPGFTGPLCEVNIDDCVDHQCQNGAMCVDDVNSYKCICRDPTTSGEFCEQLGNSYATNSANSIGPIALPMVSLGGGSTLGNSNLESPQLAPQTHSSFNNQGTILARSADFYQPPGNQINTQADSFADAKVDCKRSTQRKYYHDGNGCQSIRMLKISECAGSCGADQTHSSGCCVPVKIKRRRIRMQCNDGASYVKTIDLVKKCACSAECKPNNGQTKTFDHWYKSKQQQNPLIGQYNATQEDQLLQITRLDAVE